MKFGFHGINEGVLSEPEAMARAARAAEAAGYESIWTGERVVVLDPPPERYPLPPETRIVDTVASLAFLAGQTERLKLGSGILLLPHREPVTLAKELAGIDVLSHGRLIVGIGVGTNTAELESVGMRPAERGARTTEHIDVLKSLWTQEHPSFDGRFTTLAGIQSNPRPIQQPHPPIVVGGASPGALRRAVSQGNGWYGLGRDIERTAQALEGLQQAAQEVARPSELGRLEISVTPPGEIDREAVEQYEELGVDRLILTSGFDAIRAQPDRAEQDALIERLEQWSEQLAIG